MPTEVVTAPTQEPVTVEQVKEHLKIEHDDENLLLEHYMLAARGHVEYVLQQQIMPATLRDWFDCFPAGTCPLRLYRSPVTAVASVKYYDSAGTLQTMSSSDYVTDFISRPARVGLAESAIWPSPAGRINAVQVNYTAGYTNIVDIPREITRGIFLLVGWMERHRDEAEDELAVRNACRRLMSSQRVRVA